MHRPLTRWNHYRHTRKQTQTALRLLTLSGVVRPSTSEPRYIVSPLKVSALREARECQAELQPRVPSHTLQMGLAITRLQATAKSWVELSASHISQLHWGMGKSAWRIIGIPSIR